MLVTSGGKTIVFDYAAFFSNRTGRKIFLDSWHSENEPREMIIGHLDDRRLCLVVFTKISEDRLRIISARLATPKEQRDYERNAR